MTKKEPLTREEMDLEASRINLELAKSKAVTNLGCSLMMAAVTLPILGVMLFILAGCLFASSR